MSKFFKSKRKTPVPTPAPRTNDEIANEYSRMASEAGDREYRIRVMHAELNGIYERMVALNMEARNLPVPQPEPTVEQPQS